MSSAFTKDVDEGGALPDVGERPVSQHRNLVTHEGMAMIDAEIAFLHDAMAKAEAASDREHIALAARDLRYWSQRRETAELSVPEPDSDVVRFGMTVKLQSPDGKKSATWKITGEDEADAKHGKISHVSPMAVALFGKKAGDSITLNEHEWKIVSFGSDES
ncbi:MAG: GreA/GreB family elongation factor [Rhizobiaceae bacterium]